MVGSYIMYNARIHFSPSRRKDIFVRGSDLHGLRQGPNPPPSRWWTACVYARKLYSAVFSAIPAILSEIHCFCEPAPFYQRILLLSVEAIKWGGEKKG